MGTGGSSKKNNNKKTKKTSYSVLYLLRVNIFSLNLFLSELKEVAKKEDYKDDKASRCFRVALRRLYFLFFGRKRRGELEAAK